jgi:hypothetical protein
MAGISAIIGTVVEERQGDMDKHLREHRMGKNRGKRYRLRAPITIPAGTELGQAPSRTVRFTNHVDCDISHGPDQTSTWTIDVQDGLEAGIIEEM